MQQHYVNGVRQERTSWRDEAISARHRLWGFDCPAVDIDFLQLEYNHALPAALVDYKAGKPRKLDLDGKSYRATCALADNSQIPFVVVFYDSNHWVFWVIPVNGIAQQHFPQRLMMCERNYVSWLYRLRGIPIPHNVRVQLSTWLPNGRTTRRATS